MTDLSRFSLEGKVAVVTGGSRGIGRAIALGLAEAGADVVVTSRKLPDLEEVAAEIRKLGRKAMPIAAHIGKMESIQPLVDAVMKEFGRIDILVNNAGTILRMPAAEHPDDYWDTILEVNLTAQFVLAREFGKDMVERGKGKIIFTASLLTFQGGITVPGYAASKGGVGQLTKALANEWAPHGVNVNAIAPGYIATDNTQALRDNPTRSRQILERIPVGRWGTPDDFKGISVFLASEASNYMNGAIVLVDGGWMAR